MISVSSLLFLRSLDFSGRRVMPYLIFTPFCFRDINWKKKCEEIEAQKPITFMLLGPDCEPVLYHIHPYTPDELIFKSFHLREIFQYPNSVTKVLRHCPQIVVTSVNKTIHTPSPFLHSKWLLLFPTDSSNSNASLHRGCEKRKAFFSAF